MSSLILPSGPKIWNPRMPGGLRDGLLFLGSGEHPGSEYYHDASGRDYRGTLVGAAKEAWNNQINRVVGDYDGSTGYTTVPDCPVNTVAMTELSMGGWFALRNPSALQKAMQWGTASTNGAAWFWRFSPKQWCIHIGSTERSTTATFDADGTMHHIAVSFSGGEVRLYANGRLDSTQANTGNTGTSVYPLTIGSGAVNPPSAPMDGLIGDPFVYNRPLSGAEIQWLANPANHLRVPWRRTVWPAAAVDYAPFKIDSATGEITVANPDQMTVGDVITVTVEATDALDDTADGTWTVELVAGGTFQAAWAEGINQYIGVGV